MMGLETIIAAFIAGALAIIGLYAKARRAGAKAERAEQAQADAKARDVADDIEQAVAGNGPAKNRKELARWGR